MHTWNGFLSFGFVHIPVGLLPAAKEESIEFNQLHREDGGRVNYRKVCAACGRELAAEDIVKGYAYEKGRYVRFEPGEIERLKAASDKTIRIERFVRIGEIEPKYFEKAYYVEPGGGAQAFNLLRGAMEAEGRAGLAKVVMGTREYLSALTAEGSSMMLHKLYYASDMRPAPEIPATECGERELLLARIMIGNLAAPFRPEEYRDEFQAKLRSAIERKTAGEELPAEPEAFTPEVPENLMDALLASIDAQKGGSAL